MVNDLSVKRSQTTTVHYLPTKNWMKLCGGDHVSVESIKCEGDDIEKKAVVTEMTTFCQLWEFI